MKTARMLVRYGSHRPGKTVKGDIAEQMIKLGMAVDTTRPGPGPEPEKTEEPKPKPKRKTKNAGAAPENKAEKGES